MKDNFRPVNPHLGDQPRIGPFPPSIFLALVLVVLVSYLVKSFLNLDWIQMTLLTIWLITTWWLVTGRKAWRFYLKFYRPPHWVRAGADSYKRKERADGYREE